MPNILQLKVKPKGHPKVNKNPKRSKVCHWCGRQTVRLRGTPKGWKFMLGFGWSCPDCQSDHPNIYENK